MSDLQFNEQKGKHMGETIDGDAPYPKDWKDEIQPAKESDEKGFFVESGGEGDVNYRSAETGRFVSEEEAEANPATTVKETVDLITESQGVNRKGSPTKLNKRSLLMNLHDNDEIDGAFFVHLDGDGYLTDATHMPLEIWEDLGRPDTITVVVYPRDMLN